MGTSKRTQIMRTGAIAAAGAVVANLLVLAVGRAADVSFLVPGPGSSVPDSPVGAIPVTLMSAVPILLGTGVVALLVARGRHRAARGVLIAAAVLTVASFVPLATMGLDGGTGALLGVMHLVTGGAFLGANVRALRSAAVAPASHGDTALAA